MAQLFAVKKHNFKWLYLTVCLSVNKFVMSQMTKFALIKAIVLMIANFILLCLYLLSTCVANILIILNKENNHRHFKKSMSSLAFVY